MALPQLNSTPKYDVVIPSTGKTVRFRPFLVKEQKVLLMAYETRDKGSILKAMIDTLATCIEDANVHELTTYDVDYVFTQVRAKSVGERVELFVACGECKQDNQIAINLENISVNASNRDMDIELTDDITVRMRYPGYETLIQNGIINNEESLTSVLLTMIKSSIYSIMTQDENILAKDETPEELDKFIDSMSAEQFQKISDFIQNIPVVSYKDKFKCMHCEHENELVLEGLDDFF
jgi:predicted transport protein